MTVLEFIVQIADLILVWGWLLVVVIALWIAWETYMMLRHIDFVSSIKWTFLEVTLPEDATVTPKSFENAIEVLGGMHKDPDITEKYFEGYFLPWISCEMAFRKGVAQYIMVVPTDRAAFVEGVLYGQYPTAEIREVEDYTREFSYEDIEKTFSTYNTEVVLVRDDIYPIRTYHEFEDPLNPGDDTFIDPHQSMVETFTNIRENERYWIQVMVKPIDAGDISKWSEKGQKKIAELSGQDVSKPPGPIANFMGGLGKLPLELLDAVTKPAGSNGNKDDKSFEYRQINPAEDAEMRGILQKVSRTGYKVKVRLVYIAPKGQLHKPDIGKAIGAFKQFNSFHLNSFKPDPSTKSNGPNYILKQYRRRYRERVNFLNYQWRDFWGDDSGDMMTAEEIATIYHFPAVPVRSPSLRRAASGLGSPPGNLPYEG